MRLLTTSLLLLALSAPASAEVTSETGTGQTAGRDKVMSIKNRSKLKCRTLRAVDMSLADPRVTNAAARWAVTPP